MLQIDETIDARMLRAKNARASDAAEPVPGIASEAILAMSDGT